MRGLLFLAVALLPSMGFAQDYSRYITRANASFESGDFQVSSLYYDSAFLERAPGSFDLYNAACANSLTGNKQSALNYLKRAFEAEPFDFNWMYYDKDLDPIRNEEDYKSFEAMYKSDSTIYYFDILLALKRNKDVEYNGKRISLLEDQLSRYSLAEIETRINERLRGGEGDTLFDFSDRTVVFRKCTFDPKSLNLLGNIGLKTLWIIDGNGLLKISKIRVNNLLFQTNMPNGNSFDVLEIENVKQRGALAIYARGNSFRCEKSLFNVQLPEEGFIFTKSGQYSDHRDGEGCKWRVQFDEVIVSDVVFDPGTGKNNLSPLDFDIKARELKITTSHFGHPTRFAGEATGQLNIKSNQFPEYMDFFSFKVPEFNCYIPFSQFGNTTFVGMMEQSEGNHTFRGDSISDYADQTNFDEMTSLYKRLYDNYRSRGDITSANSSYVRLKELEIAHLKMKPDRSQEDLIRLRINQIMGLYTDHATSPGKALIISFYILLMFAVFYFFFPSEWDKTSKPQLIADFRLFIEKNEHGYVRPFFKMVKGLLLSFVNAITLSLNAFVTLGFGSIPTTGIARYVCVLQGFIGWFLLSLFSVALINQVLF